MQKEVLIQKINAVIQKYKNQNSTFCSFWHLLIEIGNFYIIGGAIRSIHNNSNPRDIDIIVKSSIKGILKNLGGNIKISRNYYGGYKIDCNGIMIDIWDFENHWAFKDGLLPADEKYLGESCFFDFDALVYSPATNYLDIDRYLHAIESRTIDFIKNDNKYVECNPGDLTNVIRAIVSANDFNLTFSAAVAAYMKDHLLKNDFESLKQCEYRHYKEEKISFEHYNKILQMVSNKS